MTKVVAASSLRFAPNEEARTNQGREVHQIAYALIRRCRVMATIREYWPVIERLGFVCHNKGFRGGLPFDPY
jgi:hypothetical protein